jgi:hypothetical protein
MVRPRQGVQSEKWLAVLDGRFLPVDELELSVERNAHDVVSARSMQSTTVKTAEIISGTVETRREPALKSRPGQLRLYGPDEEYLIWSLVIEAGVGLGLGEAYVIEFEATDWESCKR